MDCPKPFQPLDTETAFLSIQVRTNTVHELPGYSALPCADLRPVNESLLKTKRSTCVNETLNRNLLLSPVLQKGLGEPSQLILPAVVAVFLEPARLKNL